MDGDSFGSRKSALDPVRLLREQEYLIGCVINI